MKIHIPSMKFTCMTVLPNDNWAATWENRIFAYAKTKTQISFAVTAKLISVFVFATRIVQSLSFLNTKFRAFSHFLRRRSLICVGPGRKPRRPVFWRRGSITTRPWKFVKRERERESQRDRSNIYNYWRLRYSMWRDISRWIPIVTEAIAESNIGIQWLISTPDQMAQ